MSDCIPGTPNTDCTHRTVQHLHGERVTYVVDKCRGDACRESARLYERNRERQKAYGRSKVVDAEPARQHVRELMSQGMGWKRVARAAGLTPSTVYPILYGKYLDQPDHPDHRPPRKQILRKNADALLGVRLELGDGANVDATGSRRRLQALVYIGWSQANLARHLDLEGCTVWSLINGRRKYTLKANHERIAEFFEQHWNHPPADQEPEVTSRSVNHAKRQGWVPAAAWDDIDTDDRPHGVPDQAVTKLESALAKLDNLEDLAGFGEGWTRHTIRRAGFPSLAAAERAARRHNRGYLVTRLKNNVKGVAA